jgi:hypothetical protein
MSFLPLADSRTGSQTGDMNVARRIHQIITECNDAQRHLTIRRLAYDLQLPEPDAAPTTYAEFRLRTSGPLWHEPSARQRLSGRAVH